ncbi:SDR family oxidoreductase [Myxococcaceae bacterium JPH2]|nr:SDR family oxidoreductase [Myxococcaceae bacterium JPH2]
MSNEAGEVMVVGATGLLGRWLVPELTRRGRVVIAVMRQAAAREADYRAWVTALGGDATRIRVVEGDLDAPRFGWDEQMEHACARVRDVYHLGARFAWHLSADDARRTNVEGTRMVVELASRLPALRRLVLVGGYRIGPRLNEEGAVVPAPESSFDRQGAYEASKHLAHRVGWETAQRLGVPVTGVHPSSVIGDSRTGVTVQRLGLGETLHRVHAGQMPVLLGSPETFVPVIPVDFMASFLAGTPEHADTAGQEYTVLDPATPPMHELVRWAAERSGRRAPRLRLPVAWVRWLPERLLGTSAEALDFIDTARYPTEPMLALAARMGLALPPLRDALNRWFDHLRSVAFQPEVETALAALRATAAEPHASAA